MSSTVEQLNETTNTENLYVLGTQNNQSVKYNLEAIDNKIDKSNDIIGGGEIQEYSSLNNYYKGSYIKLNDKIYRVTEDIYAGENIEGKIVETSVFSEFQTIKGTGSTETLNVQILTSDNNTSPTILQNNVSIKFSDGTTQQILCDSTGHGSLSITKGRIYSASVANQAGYHTPGAYNNIKASLSQRTLQFVYTRQWEGNSTISVELSVSNYGVLNDFVGKTLTMFEDGAENAWTSSSGVVDNDKVVYTFSQPVTSGKTYTIPVFHDTNSNIYTINNRKYTNSSVNNTLSIIPNTGSQTLEINYRKRKLDSGLFLVNGTTWEETEITQEFIDTLDNTMKSTYPYIHVNTETLANVGCDYYVRCRDLTNERLATESATKQWSISMADYPHISSNTSDYNGRKNTYYMIYDSVNLGISSPAAIFATSQTLEINGEILTGYIGTVGQMSPIYSNIENRDLVISALNKIGYSTVNYISTDTLSSLEFSAQPDMYCYCWGRTGKFNAGGKINNNLLTIPFFTNL